MIRIVKNHRTDDDFLFWEGETFDSMGDNEYGAEVHTAGEYVWIPADVYEIVDIASVSG